jgi:hypothetical protein
MFTCRLPAQLRSRRGVVRVTATGACFFRLLFALFRVLCRRRVVVRPATLRHVGLGYIVVHKMNRYVTDYFCAFVRPPVFQAA